ncbi:hypothetical protein [Pseudovibrio exalbescens]|nr:hypothetical protein [Pseudovibrio exalbescens]
MQKAVSLAAAVLLFFPFASTKAASLAECPVGKGYSFFNSSEFFSDDDAGWQSDTTGLIALTVSETKEIDILYKDVRGYQSSRADGAEVSVVGVGEHSISVLVKYAAMVHSLYTFDLANKKLFYSQHRLETPIDKASTFIFDCQ